MYALLLYHDEGKLFAFVDSVVLDKFDGYGYVKLLSLTNYARQKNLCQFSEREAVKETRQAQEGDRHAAH